MKMLRVVFLMFFILAVVMSLNTMVLADCPDQKISCWGPSQDEGGTRVKCGEITVGACYQFWEMVCKPCSFDSWCGTYKPKCNSQFPNCCKDKCYVYWKGWQGSDGGCYPDNWSPPY